jgi:amino acid transporter
MPNINRVKKYLIGKPLESKVLGDEKLGVLWGLPILSSDAISSVAYAGQEILIVLIPVIGILAYSQLIYVSGAIIGLLIILTLSYRQTIDNYLNGGGAYIVAKDNLGVIAGVTAGAALSVDYVMTVAVSVSSGVEQITSAFAALKPYTVVICLAIVALLMIGNLRGLRESSKIFGLPAYAFIFAMLCMLISGFYKISTGFRPPEQPLRTLEPISAFLLLRAFSSGCTALTGVEAVSNAVPNFKEPSTKHAKTDLLLLSIIVFVLFGGTSVLANFYHVVPGEKAVLIQIAELVFGRSPIFYFIMAAIFVILVMAANTAYAGFPLLLSVMAIEGYAPRQLSMRGDRLSYSNGIIILSALSAVLILVFRADVTALVGLYAVGVFISFTLSQAGMLKKWISQRGRHWAAKAFVNGLGAFATGIAVIIIAVSKFREGSWIVVVAVPLLIFLMIKVKKHYSAVAKQLKISSEEIKEINLEQNIYRNRVIVPIESINRASIRAIKFARTISDHVTAFSVSIDEESGMKIQDRWNMLNTNIPLVVKYSPYRKVVEPLLDFIKSEEYDYKKGDMITVILPQFAVKRWWQNFLHNHTRYYIERQLLRHKHIVVSVMPLQLKDDDEVL